MQMRLNQEISGCELSALSERGFDLRGLALAKAYLAAKQVVLSAGFATEILWQRDQDFEQMSESTFLEQAAWVILSAGMRESIIRVKFPMITKSFLGWESARSITNSSVTCCNAAVQYFNHPAKIDAIAKVAQRIDLVGFDCIKKEIRTDALMSLQQFPFIGPATAFHLAKNIGLSVAKPDRHLRRLASTAGYEDVQAFCIAIASVVGDSPDVVDIVLWRFSTLRTKSVDASESKGPSQ